jgi:hypothetical protein
MDSFVTLENIKDQLQNEKWKYDILMQNIDEIFLKIDEHTLSLTEKDKLPSVCLNYAS